ncbi:ATP-binding cassette domain-containing protein [Pseudacidobacterium ailaaui]|jgi:osmoprotectant transport system ATP-binding protein|uniref:ATP-binding cassette domain-containing protein n=1 Tax=Pseudacidobacterium ailaaui TaxID=1382359 RepID=UPI00047BB36E|nr:ATP-binding cassette domain-containing protein [Pseudacidobacterium ailaaui]
MSSAIEFRDVTLATRDGRRLLDGLCLRIEEGTTVAILGRSGSGKTTLLRMVNRMARPTSGSVFVHGKDVSTQDQVRLRRRTGYVIQETGLFPHFTVERNAGLVPELNGGCVDKGRIHELLKLVGLDPQRFAQRWPHELSGGQRQRVGLARALAADPQILLMDEPFGALDPLTRAEMQQMLRGLLQRLKKTVLLVTHDLDEALYLASRIVLLEEGRMVVDLPAEEFPRSEVPAVRAYVQAIHRGVMP